MMIAALIMTTFVSMPVWLLVVMMFIIAAVIALVFVMIQKETAPRH